MDDIYNINLLIEKANDIKNAINDLKEYTLLKLEDFLEDNKLIDATKYKLLIAIEVCISICLHIATRKFRSIPSNYSECLKILSEKNIISEILTEKLINMVKFRNLLIYLYWKISNKKVFEYIKNNLKDLEAFISGISNFLSVKL
ncbi:MAG: type VII toxin-antitoxin system HepT family RNase toxin [Candidatus Helarchaeota archaeon]